jgi:ATP-dependent Lon protease
MSEQAIPPPFSVASFKSMPAIAIKNAVIFPISSLPIPLSVSRHRSLLAIEKALEEEKLILIVTQKDSELDAPNGSDLYSFGVVARILKLTKDAERSHHELLIEGLYRAKILHFVDQGSFLYANLVEAKEEVQIDDEMDALVLNMKDLAHQVVSLSPQIPDEAADILNHVTHPSQLCDLIASQLNSPTDQRQRLLEILSVKERIKECINQLAHDIAILKITGEIRSEVRDSLDKHQKEVFLREQMRAIQKQLGDEDEEDNLLKDRILDAKMPEAVEKVALRELKRMEKMNPQSAEHSVARTYLDWLLDMPWSKKTADNIDLKKAREILDDAHYGLEKVKKRMLEFLAICQLKGEVKGPILCLVGPPGVGKTSLGKSIADALGRAFIRISLGGVRDEAEIRGHRRTYVGSLPGRVVKALKKAESMNPVIMLDEIDKLGQDFRGDPGSALLEVLDPEQNNSFSDHYMEVPIDLSKALFFTTANRLDTIPPALKDRLEIIDLPGYIIDEKINIAKKHLLPKIIDEHGLKLDQVIFSDQAIQAVIEKYTREAGVRNLSRQLAGVIRSLAHDIALAQVTPPAIVDDDRIRLALGPQKLFPESKEELQTPGVSIGLAWTPVGGEILFIEATLMGGSGKLTLTGQLGEVMKESAHTAMSLIHARAEALNIDESLFSQKNIHLHLPSGAIPKDGPSAGIALVVALTSLFSKKCMKNGLAMTGEITLRGRVLPVGGIKEKVLAAARAGMKEVILPKLNEGDIEEIPAHLRTQIKFYFVEKIEEVLKIALDIDLI